jgi:hypothetical protein
VQGITSTSADDILARTFEIGPILESSFPGWAESGEAFPNAIQSLLSGEQPKDQTVPQSFSLVAEEIEESDSVSSSQLETAHSSEILTFLSPALLFGDWGRLPPIGGGGIGPGSKKPLEVTKEWRAYLKEHNIFPHDDGGSLRPKNPCGFTTEVTDSDWTAMGGSAPPSLGVVILRGRTPDADDMKYLQQAADLSIKSMINIWNLCPGCGRGQSGCRKIAEPYDVKFDVETMDTTPFEVGTPPIGPSETSAFPVITSWKCKFGCAACEPAAS